MEKLFALDNEVMSGQKTSWAVQAGGMAELVVRELFRAMSGQKLLLS